jgi:hypothetical protein
LLDDVVWAAIVDEFKHPERLQAEVDRMRVQGDPSGPTLAAIERRLADVRRQIANKRKYLDLATDDREIAEVAAEVQVLRTQERKLEAERDNTQAHFADWQATQDGLERLVDYARRVAGHLERFDFAQRRETVLTLKTHVALYRADAEQRWDGTITLPLSGRLQLPVRLVESSSSRSFTTPAPDCRTRCSSAPTGR